MKKKLLFASIFFVLGFVALHLPINQLEGSKVKFTFFDLVAPVAGSFLGITWGIVSVFSIQAFNLLAGGVTSIDKGSIIRLIPTLFGVWFFAKKEGKLLVIPALSIVIFNLHPIGRSVWFYSLFWLIPFLVWPFRDRFLILRSLGATFTAHSVGGAIWIWAFNLPASVWISLIPLVILERSIFALGISASYILFNNVIDFLVKRKLLPAGLYIDKRYLFTFKK